MFIYNLSIYCFNQIYAMTCRLQSLYECQIKPLLRKSRSNNRTHNKKGKKKSPKSFTPQKRSLPTRGMGGSANSTPRKNPRRQAAAQNPYVSHNEDESSDEHSSHSPELRPRNSRRTSLPVTNGHHSGRVNGHSSTTGTSSTPSKNGTGSSRHSTESSFNSGASGSRTSTRRVKRLRISSGESPQASPRRVVKVKAEPNSPTRGGLRKHKVVIKDEPESDEFEDSDDENTNMPTLNAHDDEYESDDSEAESQHVRRSTRGKRKHVEDEHYYGKKNCIPFYFLLFSWEKLKIILFSLDYCRDPKQG